MRIAAVRTVGEWGGTWGMQIGMHGGGRCDTFAGMSPTPTLRRGASKPQPSHERELIAVDHRVSGSNVGRTTRRASSRSSPRHDASRPCSLQNFWEARPIASASAPRVMLNACGLPSTATSRTAASAGIALPTPTAVRISTAIITQLPTRPSGIEERQGHGKKVARRHDWTHQKNTTIDPDPFMGFLGGWGAGGKPP